MRSLKKILKIVGIVLISMLIIISAGTFYLYKTADMKVPDVKIDSTAYRIINHEKYTEYNDNYLRINKFGLWELSVKGSAEERGFASGKLTKDLLFYQESVFVDQIREFIPSDGYLKFLRFLIILFNRNLGEHVPEEFRREIFAVSQSCSHVFDAIGTPYERQLNYHAAHDIGHAIQDYMLVGCSSFAVWDDKSADSSLLIGRNFDFYMGDHFAKNKLVTFCRPERGYKFASVGWPGMIGVLSGMNEKGLTVTINAASGPVPTASATPISLLAREILQYAATIDEAYEIAQKRKTFVSESLLIGSGNERKAAIIEKTPEKTALYISENKQIISTNHYQSETFRNDEYNVRNINTSDSQYRFDRLTQLLNEEQPLNYESAASILRNRFGINDEDIGIGNEKSINQSICHHSVIFKPEQRLMWVSTSPWQSGTYVCYDFDKIFDSPDFSDEIYTEDFLIAPDENFLRNDLPNLIVFRNMTKDLRAATKNKTGIDSLFIEKYIQSNPNHYLAYWLPGSYFQQMKDGARAYPYLVEALTKEIPRKSEVEEIDKQLRKIDYDRKQP